MQFTEEHEQFRKSLRRLIDEEINPHIDEWEAAGIFPAHEVFPKLAELGALGLEYDPEFGGGGADHSFTYVLAQELGRMDAAGVPMAIAVETSMATPALARYGSDELKRTYLEPTLRGEMVCSIAVSEPDAGSDVAGLRTRAVRWRRLGDHRSQDVDHQWHAGRLAMSARTHGPGLAAGRLPRHEPHHRAHIDARLQRRPQDRQDGQSLQ